MGVAYTKKKIVLTQFLATTPNVFLTNVHDICLAAEWEASYAIKAWVDLSLQGEWGAWTQLYTGPAPYALISIGGVDYLFKSGTLNNAHAGEVLLGATFHDCLANLKAAINGEPGAGVVYSVPTVANSQVDALFVVDQNHLRIRARTGGVAGHVLRVYVHGGGFNGFVLSQTYGADANGNYQPGHLIGGGYALDATSPQGLRVRLKVWWAWSGYNGHVMIMQFCSTYNESQAGYAHQVYVTSPPRLYQLWADCCQVFLSQVSGDDLGSAFQGGIPYIKWMDPSKKLRVLVSTGSSSMILPSGALQWPAGTPLPENGSDISLVSSVTRQQTDLTVVTNIPLINGGYLIYLSAAPAYTDSDLDENGFPVFDWSVYGAATLPNAGAGTGVIEAP